MLKLVADEEIAVWLAERPAFQWDAGNSMKSEVKHGHSAQEIESMMDVMRSANSVMQPRWLLLGTSAAGAPLALVFARRGNSLRPISCRAMRKSERRLYGKAVGH